MNTQEKIDKLGFTQDEIKLAKIMFGNDEQILDEFLDFALKKKAEENAETQTK